MVVAMGVEWPWMPRPWGGWMVVATAMGWLDSGSHGCGVATPPSLALPPLPVTDLELEFRYRGRQVSAVTISHPHGCRLFHSRLRPTCERVELFGPLALEQVPFPPPDAIPNQKQRFYTQQLLEVLDRGLLLELQGQDLYALRLCQCKVFWTGPCIFLCFGEEWPDQKPKEKKLIMVQVVPVAARLLLEIFSGELSWSADSVPLQISPPDLKDKMVEQFKELHQLWQNQQRLPTAQPQLVTANGGPWVLPPP
uniref:Interferon regulatory factor 5 n=1 Tax=Strix occidentalis caurina TaxID=311401 RepID=A0A8D0KR57_STROC